MTDSDRRQFIRYSPPGKTMAVFRSEDGGVMVGPIKNISRGGILFEHAGIQQQPINVEGKVDIYISEFGFFMPDIPCRIVRSTETISQDPFVAVPTPMVCCGGEFLDLPPELESSFQSVVSELGKCEDK